MRILFFRIGAIGDALLTTPAVAAVKKKFPSAKIHYMAGPAAAQALVNNPSIDKVILFKEKFPRVPRFLKVLLMSGDIRKSCPEKYDFFIDFESSYYSAYVSLFIRAKKKAGFKIKKLNRSFLNPLYTARLDFLQRNSYIAKKFIALCSALFGSLDDSLKPSFSLSREELQYGADFFKGDESFPKIALSISATWATKQWPTHYWSELAADILEKYPEVSVTILWGPGDERAVSFLKEKCPPGVKFIPPTTLREMASILSRVSLLVSNDNGVRHIGAALGLKTIGLFGPTNEKGWASADSDNVVLTETVHCRPCDKTSCPDNICMSRITPEEVLENLSLLISR